MARTIITIESDESAAKMQERLGATNKNKACRKINRYLQGLIFGSQAGTVDLQVNEGDAVAASGELTISTGIANDTVTISGTMLTCVAGSPTASQYQVGGSDAATAINLAAKINAHATLSQMVVAEAVDEVVTVSCAVKGAVGNAITMSATGGVSSNVAKLAGGVNATANTFTF